MDAFDRLESRGRRYCRAFPTVFSHARGAVLTDERGCEYIDFFAGAGAPVCWGTPPVSQPSMGVSDTLPGVKVWITSEGQHGSLGGS